MTTMTLDDMSKILQEFKIAQNYFSDILNAQLVTFSIIVGALIGLSWIFSHKVSEAAIHKEVKKKYDDLKIEMDKQSQTNYESLKGLLETEVQLLKSELGLANASIYRTMGHFWDSQKSYSTAFIWWMRAAELFVQFDDESLARIALKSAKESLEKISYEYNLSIENRSEFQKIISLIKDDKYSIEKELLTDEFKKVLKKTFSAGKTTPSTN